MNDFESMGSGGFSLEKANIGKWVKYNETFFGLS